MNCENCDRLSRELLETSAILEKIRAILNDGISVRRGRAPKEYATEVGKLIAATASAKNLKLSEVSKSAGFAGDYVARICRGDLILGRRAAILVGSVLGVDLGKYIGTEFTLGATPDEIPHENTPGLPFAGDARVA